MPKIQKNKNEQFTINIPKNIIRFKNWEKSTELLFIPDEKGNITLKELKFKENKNE